MAGLLKRGAMTILGVAVMLGFWTVKGWLTDEASASLSHIPQKVWDGGAERSSSRSRARTQPECRFPSRRTTR
jgi:hypothetical protein